MLAPETRAACDIDEALAHSFVQVAQIHLVLTSVVLPLPVHLRSSHGRMHERFKRRRYSMPAPRQEGVEGALIVGDHLEGLGKVLRRLKIANINVGIGRRRELAYVRGAQVDWY